ncbi:type 4a pilus biogenesis protein PilO [Curtobacterium sp. MCSS17_007]|uniref:type 4a pilus biogenesis protein PilO n=1 Tax=Curtobacterium sp. MCSS17_007 TaxID=2175646 RepID=UPI000DA91D4F|nr:type 4a pilus biogenesis protein PilO [Curtobacterium sp. MCSS17_007]WIE75480.1 type 4a pilus biogenesis protein PilO [Curtobacterium sp. MCSS17_007]
MSRTRLNLMLAVLAMVVVAVGGFFLAVQPQLTQTAAAREQLQTVEQTNATSRTELARLREQAAQLPAMREELSALDASVPDRADLPAFIDQLNGVAAATGMTVSSFTASDATAYAPVAAAPAGDTTATSEPSSTATPAPSASPTAPELVTNPAITAQNLSIVPVTVAVDGTFDQALAFVKGVQSGQRLFLITTITSSEQSGDDGATTTSSTWTFGGSVYVLDRSTDASAGSAGTSSEPSSAATSSTATAG